MFDRKLNIFKSKPLQEIAIIEDNHNLFVNYSPNISLEDKH